MKLPNWFKIFWWGLLLILLSIGVFSRYDNYLNGDVTYLDGFVLLLWVALALVPIFQEVKLWGINLKQSLPVMNQQEVKEINTFEKSLSESKKEPIGLMKQFDSPAIIRKEAELTLELEGVLPEEKNERFKFFMRILAVQSLYLSFERIFPIIYESQVNLLMNLNVRTNYESIINEIKYFYDNAKLKYPLVYEHYNFENWLGFLQTNNLIIVGPDKIKISEDGVEFLKYIGTQRLNIKNGFY